jgi:hypothetical protein
MHCRNRNQIAHGKSICNDSKHIKLNNNSKGLINSLEIVNESSFSGENAAETTGLV